MKMLNGCRSWYQMVDGREATWSCSLSVPSAQPGLGVCQEHVLEVLVCQHGHLHPLAGAGLHPAQEAGTSWKLAPAVQTQPVCASSQDLQ